MVQTIKWYSFVLLGVLVPATSALGGPIAMGHWRAEADGTAEAGPLGEAGGAKGQLGFLLLNEWIPNQAGFVRAEIPPDPLKAAWNINIVVPPKSASDIWSFTMSITFIEQLTPKGPPTIVSIGPSVGFNLAAPVDDSYSVKADAFAVANGDTASDAHEKSSTGEPVKVSASAHASQDGTPTTDPRMFQSWGIFSDSLYSLDGGPLMSIHSTSLERGTDGIVHTMNMTTDLPNGPLTPGVTYTASDDFQFETKLGPGTHTLHFETSTWGFLQTEIVGTPEPTSASLALIGTFLTAIYGWRHRKRLG